MLIVSEASYSDKVMFYGKGMSEGSFQADIFALGLSLHSYV